MGAIASRSPYVLDKAASVLLRSDTAAAITATTAETAISLSELNKAWWANFEIPHGKFVVAFDIVSCDAGDSDETYVLALLVDDVVAMNNSPVTIDQWTLPRGTTGVFTRVIDSRDIPALDPDHNGGDKFIQVKATLGGTTPSLKYTCWMAKSLGA